MKKINIIKKNYEINSVINEKNGFKNKYFYIYKSKNNLNKYRFAICVSKKIGNAVTRNKVKRQIKDVIDKSKFLFKYSDDYVIIVRKEINNLNYDEINKNLNDLLSKVLS